MAEGNGQGQFDPLLEEASMLMAAKQLELEARGYTPALVEAAISRARGMAQHWSSRLSLAIRSQGFLDHLTHELAWAEEWIQRELKNSEARAVNSSAERG